MFRRVGRSLVYTVSGVSLAYCTLRYVCGIGKVCDTVEGMMEKFDILKISTFQCEDVSMEPAIQHGDFVLLTPFNVATNRVTKGDVVFCRAPKDARSVICKRVAGMEGDTVNNEDTGRREFINKGHVWLEGDNREASIDSRTFGSVPYGLLISKVSARVWPPSRIGFLSFQQQQEEEPQSE